MDYFSNSTDERLRGLDQEDANEIEPRTPAPKGDGRVRSPDDGTSAGSRAWRWLVRVVVVLIGFAVGGALAESVVRALLPHWAPRTVGITRFWHHDTELGWTHVPGARGRFNAFGHESFVAINGQGFRDVERSRERKGALDRIVVLGDSMVWGYGVENDELFTILMERAHSGLEVLNLGVSGYGTDQELLLLERDALRYRPDLIVVVVAENDFQTNVQTQAYLIYQKPMFELTAQGDLRLTNVPVPLPALWERAASAVLRNSFVLNELASRYHALTLEASAPAPGPVSGVPRPFPSTWTEKLTVAMLGRMQAVAGQARMPFAVVLSDGLGRRGRELEAFLVARATRVLNLDHDFPKGPPEAFHLQDGVHWNAAGHRRVADRILRYLEEEGLILRGSAPHPR